MMCTEAIVLVGGLGTRLRPVVSDVPKPMAPVAGRPFLAWLLEMLSAQGICRVVLATGYLSGMIQSYFGRHWGGMAIDYSIEDTPLGTGGAIAKALGSIGDVGVHVLNGDTFLQYRLASLECVTLDVGASIGMALATVPDVGRYGAVEMHDRRVSRFREKGESGSGSINAGCYFLTAACVERFSRNAGGFSFETEVLAPAVARGDVCGFDDTGGFIDIGVPEDYARVEAFMAGVVG